jgi:hypothetical protein
MTEILVTRTRARQVIKACNTEDGTTPFIKSSIRVGRWTWTLSGAVLGLLGMLGVKPAAAQFSAHEGFTASGTPEWTFEISPYLFLPNIDATIGLAHPTGFDFSVNQARPTVSKLTESLTGAFTADNLARYGNWSGELNILYVAGQATRNFPPIVAGGPGASLKATASEVLVSPGFGYRVLPTDPSSNLALDLRAGFTYNSVSAGAQFAQSRLGGVNVSSTFVQPWVGGRVSYYPSPDWRIVGTTALTGLGVDGGTIGWNGRVGVSYLITTWADVTLGYAATQTVRSGSRGVNGENRSVDLLAYGPFLAVGFRF